MRKTRCERLRLYIALCSTLFLVTACGGVRGPDGPSKEPPKFTGVKIGKPYEISGKWYYPKDDPYYDKEGVASWYGPGFHGRATANGEIYNQYDLTAAHPTLPMPSIVEVTNLENGRSLQVRVNDRGPFHDNRIIDLSKESARKLGVTGLAKVRVRLLREETQAYIDSRGKTTVPSTRATRLAKAMQPKQSQQRSLQSAKIGEQSGFVPLLVANNKRSVVQSAPVTSVDAFELPAIISSANAAEVSHRPKKRLAGNYAREGIAQAPLAVKAAPQKDDIPLSYQPFKKQSGSVVRDVQAVREPTVPQVADVAVLPPPRNKSAALAPAPKAKVKTSYPGWKIKVASFSSRDNAKKMIQKLRPHGRPEIEAAYVNGKQWYRVLLQPTNNQNPSQLLSAVRRLGAHDAHVM